MRAVNGNSGLGFPIRRGSSKSYTESSTDPRCQEGAVEGVCSAARTRKTALAAPFEGRACDGRGESGSIFHPGGATSSAARGLTGTLERLTRLTETGNDAPGTATRIVSTANRKP